MDERHEAVVARTECHFEDRRGGGRRMFDAIVGFVIGVVWEFAAEFEAQRREGAVPPCHCGKCQSWETDVEEPRELVVGVRHGRTVPSLGLASVPQRTLKDCHDLRMKTLLSFLRTLDALGAH